MLLLGAVLIALLLGLVYLTGGFGSSMEGQSDPRSVEINPAAAPEVGAPAPDFILIDTHGKQFRLSDLRGQPVLHNFWATWCGPCRIEMPDIQARYQEFQDQELVVLAVNFDEAYTLWSIGDSTDTIRRLLRKSPFSTFSSSMEDNPSRSTCESQRYVALTLQFDFVTRNP